MDSSSMLSKPATQAELNSALIKAIKDEDTIDTIKQLISAGADVNAVDEDEFSSLSYAAKNGNIAMVNILLPYIDLNAFNNPIEDSWLITHPLCLAAYFGNIEVILALLPKLNIAAWNIATPADFMKSSLMELGKCNHPEIIKVLTTIVSSFDAKTLNSLNQDGQTMLHKCILHNSVALASVLIALKADLNMKNNQGYTALMDAAQQNRFERFDIMSMLIKAGADITAVGPKNCTTLSCANNRKTQLLLLSAMPKESILLQKQSRLRNIAIDCIQSVNKIRDTLFHTLFALQTRKRTSLPNDPSTLVLSYLEQPKWYDHRFGADIQAMLKRVGMVLRRREEAAKQARVINSTATQLRPNALTLLAVPAQTFLLAVSSGLDRGVKRSSQNTTAPVGRVVSGCLYPKRTRSFTRPNDA